MGEAAMGNALELVDTVVRRAAKLPVATPPPLTLPLIFHHPRDENFLSHYLAYALDPKHNGLGLGPMKALLRQFGEDVPSASTRVVVWREANLDDGRIDLLIEVGENNCSLANQLILGRIINVY